MAFPVPWRDMLAAAVPIVLVTGLAAAWTLADHSPPHDDDFALYRTAVCMTDDLLAGTTGCWSGAP